VIIKTNSRTKTSDDDSRTRLTAETLAV